MGTLRPTDVEFEAAAPRGRLDHAVFASRVTECAERLAETRRRADALRASLGQTMARQSELVDQLRGTRLVSQARAGRRHAVAVHGPSHGES